jgi:hypothetical protein
MLFAIKQNAVRDESEHCSRSIGIVFAIARITHQSLNMDIIRWDGGLQTQIATVLRMVKRLIYSVLFIGFSSS